MSDLVTFDSGTRAKVDNRVDFGLATGRPGRPTWPSQIGDFGFGLDRTWPSLRARDSPPPQAADFCYC